MCLHSIMFRLLNSLLYGNLTKKQKALLSVFNAVKYLPANSSQYCDGLHTFFFFFNPSLQISLVLTLICELNKVFDRCLFYINIKS